MSKNEWQVARDWARSEAEDILTVHWDGTLPVDPIAIARSQSLALYEAPLPNDISGMIREPKIKASEGKRAEIVVDRDEIPTRARFTIAHELGHYRRHVHLHGEKKLSHIDYRRRGVSTPEEYGANEFAGALLMPTEEFTRAVQRGESDSSLARIFSVSVAAVRVRRQVLGLST